jgi:hypothetical protein
VHQGDVSVYVIIIITIIILLNLKLLLRGEKNKVDAFTMVTIGIFVIERTMASG